ncbi:hypothetical protein Cgig2_020157 [Carnegiea gigantea]|uniref:Uncharacterized protein n=1 Tax=Carnegiea gigantea TaxID=171969 RepID=A0A9Q1KWS8_9CARY|nr:hypothetical protein Cgig2_020157 [Carnegiea gigantea]
MNVVYAFVNEDVPAEYIQFPNATVQFYDVLQVLCRSVIQVISNLRKKTSQVQMGSNLAASPFKCEGVQILLLPPFLKKFYSVKRSCKEREFGFPANGGNRPWGPVLYNFQKVAQYNQQLLRGNKEILKQLACLEAFKQLHDGKALSASLVPDVVLEESLGLAKRSGEEKKRFVCKNPKPSDKFKK